MILIKENRIVRGDLHERIVKWEVWFATPWGLCQNTLDAVEALEAEGLDPNQMMMPVCVAISESTYEVMRSLT